MRKWKFRVGECLTWGHTASGRSLHTLHTASTVQLQGSYTAFKPHSLNAAFNIRPSILLTIVGVHNLWTNHVPFISKSTPLMSCVFSWYILDLRKFIFQNDSFCSANCKARLQWMLSCWSRVCFVSRKAYYLNSHHVLDHRLIHWHANILDCLHTK